MTPDQERQAQELMRQGQEGNQTAYADLLVLLTHATRRFARARLGAAPWVDDVVQETLLAVHVARHTYDVRRPFGPWFYAVARSRLIDTVRRQRRVAGHESAAPDWIESVAGPQPEGDDIDVDAIRRALAALPSRQRDVIEGLKYRDESVREIAGRLGLSESAVKVTAHRGYRALRRLLGGR